MSAHSHINLSEYLRLIHRVDLVVIIDEVSDSEGATPGHDGGLVELEGVRVEVADQGVA